jgi:transcriptional regulator with XRE-family HTH domain
MSFLEEVGKRLKKQRDKLGWTQAELIDNLPADIDLTDKQVSRLEKGKSGTGLETFTALSLTLQKTPDYFMLGHDRKSTTIKELIAEIEENLYLCELNDLESFLIIAKAFAQKK